MDDLADALGALRWWRDAGVDMLVDDEPRDWLRPAAQLAPIAPTLPRESVEPLFETADVAPPAPLTPAAETLPATLED